MKKCKDIISNEIILKEITKELMKLPTEKLLDAKKGYVDVIKLSDIKEFFGY